MKFKKRHEILLPICVLFFFVASIISIYSTSGILSANYNNLYIKQLMWYAIGFGLFLFVILLGNEKILRYSWSIYLLSIVLLILVLIIGNEVNNTRGWLNFGGLSFQPSEFAKLGLIFYLAKILNDFHFEEKKNWKNEVGLLFKIFFVTLIPSILVFVEPDTGAVISYFSIAIIMIFISEIRARWVIILSMCLLIVLFLGVLFYIKCPTEFINFFGDNFYYRIFRIVDWKNSSGMQLENSLIAIGSSGLFGHGLNKIPIYFPEPYTDFIFTAYTSNFGLIGAIVLIIVMIIFNFKIIKIGINTSNTFNKYIITGILICFLFPQLQNIGMTIGLVPITGITLPFISYGGSSLIISFIMVATLINCAKNS